VEFAGNVGHSAASRAENIDALFFMLESALWGSHKKRVRTRYAKPVFLHPIGSMGHIERSSASG
jgi:hypothetical protein